MERKTQKVLKATPVFFLKLIHGAFISPPTLPLRGGSLLLVSDKIVPKRKNHLHRGDNRGCNIKVIESREESIKVIPVRVEGSPVSAVGPLLVASLPALDGRRLIFPLRCLLIAQPLVR